MGRSGEASCIFRAVCSCYLTKIRSSRRTSYVFLHRLQSLSRVNWTIPQCFMDFPCRLQLLSRRNGTILRCIIRFLHRFQSQSHRKWHIPQGSAALIVCAMKSPVIIHFEVAGHMGPYAKTVFTADKTLARLILLDQSS